jgi:hypothetical protein
MANAKVTIDLAGADAKADAEVEAQRRQVRLAE